MYEPIRGGTRGGQAEFKWSDVSADKDREVSIQLTDQLLQLELRTREALLGTQHQRAHRQMAKE